MVIHDFNRSKLLICRTPTNSLLLFINTRIKKLITSKSLDQTSLVQISNKNNLVNCHEIISDKNKHFKSIENHHRYECMSILRNIREFSFKSFRYHFHKALECE